MKQLQREKKIQTKENIKNIDQKINKIKNQNQKKQQQKLFDYSKYIKEIIKIQKIYRKMKLRENLKKISKKMKYRYHIIKQIISSQLDYLLSINLLNNQFKPALLQSKVITKDQINKIFLNIKSILELNSKFCQDMQNIFQDYNRHTKISQILLNYLPFFKIYVEYYNSFQVINYQKDSNSLLKQLKQKKPAFREILNTIQANPKNIKNLDIQSLLVKPIQRLPQYVLLLKDLNKNTPDFHTDKQNIQKALLKYENLNQENNLSMEKYINSSKLMKLQNIFNSEKQKQKIIVNNKRDYCTEFELFLLRQDKSIEVTMYLLTDMILLSHQVKMEQKPLNILQLDQKTDVKNLPNAKYYKNVFMIKINQTNLTFYAQTPQIKKHCIDKIKFLILNIKNSLSLQTINYNQKYVDATVIGVQQRNDGLLSKYTAYIINIQMGDKKAYIVTRFSQIAKLQEYVKKNFPKLKLPILQKQDVINTYKSKTIQKRKFLIQNILSTVLSNPSVQANPDQILAILKIPNFFSEVTLRNSQNQQKFVSLNKNALLDQKQITVYLENKDKIIVHLHKNGTCQLLLNKVLDKLKMQAYDGFKLLFVRLNAIRLILDDQIIWKLNEHKCWFQSEKDSYILFTRYMYRQKHIQQQLYISDTIRMKLQMIHITDQIKSGKYNIQLQKYIMLACYYMIIYNYKIDQTNKLTFYNKLKQFLPNNVFNKIKESNWYCKIHKINQEISKQILKNKVISVYFLLLQVMYNINLYGVYLFNGEFYNKTFKKLSEQFNKLHEKCLLGVKNSKLIFLNQKKQQIFELNYVDIINKEEYPTALIFNSNKFDFQIRFNTTQSFQISYMINNYMQQIRDLY